MQYSIIQKSQLEGAHRLDAEYYQPEYLNLLQKLHVISAQRLGDIAYVTDGEHGSPIWDEESGIKYFSAQHVRDGFIDGSDANMISRIIDEKNKRSRLKEGDVLLSTVGTIGFAGVVTEDLLPANIDRHVGRIALKPNTLSPEFLVAFLNSSYGKFQSIRESTGNVQLNLFIDKIKELIVPSKDNQDVAQLIKDALQKLRSSQYFYFQAENSLLEELGLNNFEVEDDLSYIVNLSEIKSSHRADAEYFQPKYDKLVERIKKYGAVSLLDLVQNVSARFNPKSQPTTLFQYVELSNITSSVGIIDGYSEVAGDEAPSRAKRMLKANDVIFSSVEGSLEKVALVGKEQEGYLASNGFFQFRSKGISPEVLMVLAKSFVLQMQFEKQTAGTILTAVPKEAVKNIVIPKINKPTQQKIADLAQKSHEARKKAKGLLEEAKHKVEELIENRAK